MAKFTKEEARHKRKIRIRKKISGTNDIPRLVVFRSNLHVYASLVDDANHATLATASTLALNKKGDEAKCDKAGATLVGKEIARLAKENNITRVVFDRNGYIFHGRVKAVADGARESGLKF